jgi:hypothetical protein
VIGLIVGEVGRIVVMGVAIGAVVAVISRLKPLSRIR